MKIRGKVIFYLPRKRFGFIHAENGEKFFCHFSEFQAGLTPKVNLFVEFERGEPVSATGKYDLAINIVPIEQASNVDGWLRGTDTATSKGEGGVL